MPPSLPRLPEERQHRIRERLATSGRVIAAELAREWRTSEDTIRRDLRDLAAAGLCRRVHGGALPPSPAGGPLRERLTTDSERKDRLARAAAALVAPGSLVFLDAGSTNTAIARALPEDADLTVATNAPDLAVALLQRPGIEVIQVGGPVDVHTGACLGEQASRESRVLRPAQFFMGTCAVDGERGVTASRYEEALFKTAIAERSERVICVVTLDKLGTAAPYHVLPTEAVDTLVVEAGAPSAALEAIRAAGPAIVGADVGEIVGADVGEIVGADVGEIVGADVGEQE